MFQTRISDKIKKEFDKITRLRSDGIEHFHNVYVIAEKASVINRIEFN